MKPKNDETGLTTFTNIQYAGNTVEKCTVINIIQQMEFRHAHINGT